MSTTGIATRRIIPRAPLTTVALVVGDAPDERIVDCLGRHGVALAPFSRIEDLVSESVQQDYSAIVLWAEGRISAPARLIEPLTHRFARTPIVMVCEDIERWAVRATLAAGIAGVVLADDLNAALWPCLQAVHAGQTCVPRGHWRQIEPSALSSREKQILGLVVMGYTNSRIGAQLFLAESTVKSHLSSAFGKLGVRSRNEAVDLILDPARGLGMGILALGGEPVLPASMTAR